MKWQLLSRNPADAVEAPKPSRPDMQTLGPDEVRTLLALLDKHPDRELFISAVFTGMRQGELLGLRWSDVDLDKGMARIQQTVGWLPKQGFIFREPKTKKSRRQIVLPAMVIDAFKKRKKQQAEDKLMLGQEYEDIGLVFCTAYGQPLDPSGVSRRFKTVAKKLGRSELRFHDLRHTHATLLLSQGVHPKIVQERLGHESINITLDIYSHVLPGMQEEAVTKLENFFLNSNGHIKGTSNQK
ncbi:MAG: site-specific integrase [Dethiobacter sp.]|nr:site-specific integrase [Dethiobacter sp.]MBS3898491.1 site-specific integrase [Dethiobacter sp.]